MGPSEGVKNLYLKLNTQQFHSEHFPLLRQETNPRETLSQHPRHIPAYIG